MSFHASGDEKYQSIYVPDDLYWGLGIENESYFQAGTRIYTGEEIQTKRKRERYSVDYNPSFKKCLSEQLAKQFPAKELFRIPIYVNSHSFSKCDINHQHRTLYLKDLADNPKFLGKTIDQLLLLDDYFKDNFGKIFLYDGDSIEVISSQFYKATAQQIVSELISSKQELKSHLQDTLNYFGLFPELDYPKANFGLVAFHTNLGNLAMCNNGTYHINITLPTQLEGTLIKDFPLFVKQHQNAINILQWVEPLIIGYYGSPDLLSLTDNKLYSKGSLRCCLSRYIGVGSYDTKTMKPGKMLREYVTNLKKSTFYERIQEELGYNLEDQRGYDVNFNKHWNLGIEIRFLDWFPEQYLEDLLKFLFVLFDHSLMIDVPSIDSYDSWQDMTFVSLRDGCDCICPDSYVLDLSRLLGVHFEDHRLESVLLTLADVLYQRYGSTGPCSSRFSPNMSPINLFNVNRYMRDCNLEQYFN